jgi:tetratricopeptide (TPR) repeat protein
VYGDCGGQTKTLNAEAVTVRYQISARIVAAALTLPLVAASGLFQACKGNQEPENPTASQGLDIDAHGGAGSRVPERRVALVVGNSRYRKVSYLNNPRNDARLIAKSLKSVGFELVDGGPQLDLDKAAFDRTVQDFGDKLPGAAIALFYYAGHGIQVNGSNYLVPISANPTKESDVDFQMVDAETILHQMEDGNARLNILILDACRNNPFGGRSIRSVSSGLAQMQAPDGTMIFYATQPGAVADDGEGNDSPFTEALAETIPKPGLDISRAFNQVAVAVQDRTGRNQRPWLAQSPIEGDFFFVNPAPVPTPALAAPALGSGVPDPDVVFWLSITDRNNPEYLKSYLKEFPNGRFADIARLRLKDETRSAPKPPTRPAESAAAEIPAAEPTPTPSAFTAKMAGVMDRYAAEAMMNHLVQSGYQPYLAPTKIGGQTWYQVEVGPFASEAEARAAEEKLNALRADQQVASAPRASSHPSGAIAPSLNSDLSARSGTVQMDGVMSYGDAVSAIMRLARLGYQAHLAPITVDGRQKYKVEASSSANDRQAREARKKLHELSRQQTLAALPPLGVTPAPDAASDRQTARDRGPYKIQAEDTTDPGRAQMIMKRLRRLGYEPRLAESNEDGRTWYHIEIGAFASEDEADAAQEELRRRYESMFETPVNSKAAADEPHAASPPHGAAKTNAAPAAAASSNPEDQGNYAEPLAEDQGEGALDARKYAAASFYNRGSAFLTANRDDDAITQFQKAVELNPDDADAFYGWGLALYHKHDLDAAIAKLRKATALNPSYANAYYNWGLALYAENNVSGAISKFEKTVELDSDYADAYYNWALALSRKGELNEAILKFQKATELKPGYADAYYGWGVALYHNHKLDGAVSEYEKALELAPANESYKKALASAQAEQRYSRAAGPEPQR